MPSLGNIKKSADTPSWTSSTDKERPWVLPRTALRWRRLRSSGVVGVHAMSWIKHQDQDEDEESFNKIVTLCFAPSSQSSSSFVLNGQTEYQKTSNLIQSSMEMAHLHYASPDSIHTPSMPIRYSYSESHLRKRRPVNTVPLLPQSYPTRWPPLFIATYSGTPNTMRPICL